MIAEPAILTIACLPESAIGRSPSYTAARFARLRELFEREGIKFAHREVTVRIADEEGGRPPLGEAQKQAVAAAARSAVELPQLESTAPRDDR